MIRLGAQVSASSGFLETVRAAGAAGYTALQVFSRSPVGGQSKALPPPEAMRAQLQEAGIRPLLVHAPYFVNPAADDPAMARRARIALDQEMGRVQQLGAHALIMHCGHVQSDRDRAERQVVSVIQVMLSRPGLIWLENTAGQGQELGCEWGELGRIIQAAGSSRVGVLVDTAHAMAYGYPLTTQDDARQFLDTLDHVVGLDRIGGLHLNDLAYPVGSRRDRHAALLAGPLGLEALEVLLGMASERSWAVILETPGKDLEARERDVDLVRRLVTAS